MYKQFYRLTRNPFEISPDPRFYYATPLHNEALASLIYGVNKRKGFVVTTGEVGTGKSLLVHCFLQWMTRNRIAFSHIFNPRLTVIEFLQYLLSDLELRFSGQNKTELLIQLNQYLISRYRKGATSVLVVDEGQLLDWDVLEEIRLLTNLETAQQKLLQIVLVGQPELDEKLESPRLRQLKQRIAFRCRLSPLSEKDVQAYIMHRLEIAGANSHSAGLFPEPTLAAIARYSRGIPRLVNTICENALIEGYAKELHSIPPEVIERIAADSRLEAEPGSPLLGDCFDREAAVKDVLKTIEGPIENVETK